MKQTPVLVRLSYYSVRRTSQMNFAACFEASVLTFVMPANAGILVRGTLLQNTYGYGKLRKQQQQKLDFSTLR
jgi:hypothetical protein